MIFFETLSDLPHREAAERLDAEAATAVPFWGGLDHNPGNVMRNASG